MFSIPLFGISKTNIVAGFGIAQPPTGRQNHLHERVCSRERPWVYRGFFDSQVKVSGLVPMETEESHTLDTNGAGSLSQERLL